MQNGGRNQKLLAGEDEPAVERNFAGEERENGAGVGFPEMETLKFQFLLFIVSFSQLLKAITFAY